MMEGLDFEDRPTQFGSYAGKMDDDIRMEAEMEAGVVSDNDVQEAAPASQPALFASGFAQSKQELLMLVNELRSDGIGAEVPLPSIVVIGNQSCGKSSLIESISGINLPRSAGTCTRVPIEVRLRASNNPWTCRIKIRWETGAGGTRAQIVETPFGDPFRKRDRVADQIRRAQYAVLNPEVAPEDFIECLLDDGLVNTRSFAGDVVVVEVSGSDVVDLTLVDLPGIIQVVGPGEDESNKDLIKGLIRRYISDKNALILLVLPMSDDWNNQEAMNLVQEPGADKEGIRTIGVLTKADMVRGGDTRRWIDVLAGRSDIRQLKYGYYVTRQPDTDELERKITFAEARANESAFFTDMAPWNTLEGTTRQRLGTGNLAAAMSNHLLHHIQEGLPQIIKLIEEQAARADREYASLGAEPSANPALEVLKLVGDLKDHIQNEVMGRPEHVKFMQKVRQQYKEFGQSIWRTVPRFDPRDDTHRNRHNNTEDNEVDVVEDNEDDEADDQVSSKKYGIDLATLNMEVLEAPNQPTARGSGGAYHVTTLHDLRSRIDKSLTRELPGHVPFATNVELIRDFTSDWSRISEDLLHDIVPVVERMLNAGINNVFKAYAKRPLVRKVRDCATATVNTLRINARILLSKFAEMEEIPFTLNEHYLRDVKQKVLARFQEIRHPGQTGQGDDASSAGSDGEMEPDISDEMKDAMAAFKKKFGWSVVLATTHEPEKAEKPAADPYQEELELMAFIRAYWQIAYKRIIDNVPRIIDHELLLPLHQQINAALISESGVFDPSNPNLCRDLLAESADRVEQRKAIRAKRDRLARARQRTKELHTGR